MWFLFLKYFLCVKWFSYKTDLDRNNKPWYSLSKMKTKIKNKKERKKPDKQQQQKKAGQKLKPSSERNWIKGLHKNQILKEELTKWVSQVLKAKASGFSFFFFSLGFLCLETEVWQSSLTDKEDNVTMAWWVLSPWQSGSTSPSCSGPDCQVTSLLNFFKVFGNCISTKERNWAPGSPEAWEWCLLA